MLLVGVAGRSTEAAGLPHHSRRQHAVSHTVQPWFSNPAAPPRLEGNAKPGDPSISVTTARDKLQLKKGYRRVKVSSARTLQSPLPSPASCLGICTGHHGQKLNAFSLSGVNRWAPDSKWKWGKEMGIAKPEVPNPPNSPTRG